MSSKSQIEIIYVCMYIFEQRIYTQHVRQIKIIQHFLRIKFPHRMQNHSQRIKKRTISDHPNPHDSPSICLSVQEETERKPESQDRISVLQNGQWAWFSTHGIKHREWNLWAHDRFTKVSPPLNFSKQMAHSSCSFAFQLISLGQVDLFVPVFFNPNTSVCSSLTAAVDLPSATFNFSSMFFFLEKSSQKILEN